MEAFFTYLEKQISACNAEIAALTAQSRKDDANFAKVRANIYSVCQTVGKVHMNRPGGGVGALETQLLRFRSEWGAALEKAKAHNDVAAVAVEETKLAVLEDVIARFNAEAAK